jgi:hypothetical protein
MSSISQNVLAGVVGTLNTPTQQQQQQQSHVTTYTNNSDPLSGVVGCISETDVFDRITAWAFCIVWMVKVALVVQLLRRYSMMWLFWCEFPQILYAMMSVNTLRIVITAQSPHHQQQQRNPLPWPTTGGCVPALTFLFAIGACITNCVVTTLWVYFGVFVDDSAIQHILLALPNAWLSILVLTLVQAIISAQAIAYYLPNKRRATTDKQRHR